MWNIGSLSTVHNKSVHTCICVSVYVHIFLNYAFPWRNIYSCCFCPSPNHYFHGHRAITPISWFAAPSSNPTFSVSVRCLSGLLLCPAAGSNKFLPNVVIYPPKCTVPRSQATVICIATTWRTSGLTFCFPVWWYTCAVNRVLFHIHLYTLLNVVSFPRLLLCYRSDVT